LSRDRILGVLNLFEKGSGKFNEPRRALVLTFFISMMVLYWGGKDGVQRDGGDGDGGTLNAVAMVVTMFFLYTYGMVNLALFVESFGANPSFRPRFRYYHWGTALFGAISCVVVSFFISPGASMIALFFIGILFLVSRRREMSMTFGDARRGFVYSRIRNNLLRLSTMAPDPKNWRPTITVFSGNPDARKNLIDYATLFECSRGILSVAEIIPGNPETAMDLRRDAIRRMERFALENELDFFPEVVVCEDFDRGLRTFLQSHSLGPIKPNIAMFGWPNESTRTTPFVSHLRIVAGLGRSCLVFVNPVNYACPKIARGRIDVWWRGMKNGSLMLLLAHLLRNNRSWNRVEIRVLRTVREISEIAVAENELRTLIASSRIDAEAKAFVSDAPFNRLYQDLSQDATLTFTGFVPPADEYAESFFRRVNERMSGMPPGFLVCSSGEADMLA
jgi:hypothetical protein